MHDSFIKKNISTAATCIYNRLLCIIEERQWSNMVTCLSQGHFTIVTEGRRIANQQGQQVIIPKRQNRSSVTLVILGAFQLPDPVLQDKSEMILHISLALPELSPQPY